MLSSSKVLHPHAALIDLGLEENTRRLRFCSMPEAYPLAVRIEEWMRALAYPPRDIFSVRLILLEAVSNAIRHGHGNDLSKQVEVRYLVRPVEVVLEVRDQGRGFDPMAVPDPRLDENLDKLSGRGLFLMQLYASALSFNPQGNQVTLYRRRSDV
jgi:anti-sigma regulatory factor (Ser/Thr protein kinase)